MNPVNLFFACDNAYVPFLAVTLTSLKENCNPKRDYALRILHTGLDPENIRRLTDSFASDGFTMEFIDITQAVEQFADKLEQACFTTLNQGTMTKDLVGLVDEGVQAHAVTSAAFLAAVRGNLEASL